MDKAFIRKSINIANQVFSGNATFAIAFGRLLGKYAFNTAIKSELDALWALYLYDQFDGCRRSSFAEFDRRIAERRNSGQEEKRQ